MHVRCGGGRRFVRRLGVRGQEPVDGGGARQSALLRGDAELLEGQVGVGGRDVASGIRVVVVKIPAKPLHERDERRRLGRGVDQVAPRQHPRPQRVKRGARGAVGRRWPVRLLRRRLARAGSGGHIEPSRDAARERGGRQELSHRLGHKVSPVDRVEGLQLVRVAARFDQARPDPGTDTSPDVRVEAVAHDHDLVQLPAEALPAQHVDGVANHVPAALIWPAALAAHPVPVAAERVHELPEHG
mmetsp:Transcript_7402/g.23696  ORF Transcript_7402/g.23696 Transcript_7402/m.23696 type:complete len:243 (+) Transcript_7402:1245-1973(+)